MKRLNIGLGVIFLASIAANLAIRHDMSRPNSDFLPQMVRTARYNAYAPNPNFVDGKTLQSPPPGSIPRGFQPVRYQPTPGDAARAGEELMNPFAATSVAAVERGAFVYATFCQPCHGGSGSGDGPVAMRGFPPPPSLPAPRARGLKDGQMFHILAFGQKNMPSYSSQISQHDRWKVILYVRTLQEGRRP